MAGPQAKPVTPVCFARGWFAAGLLSGLLLSFDRAGWLQVPTSAGLTHAIHGAGKCSHGAGEGRSLGSKGGTERFGCGMAEPSPLSGADVDPARKRLSGCC